MKTLINLYLHWFNRPTETYCDKCLRVTPTVWTGTHKVCGVCGRER